jgi:hypothetical protein
MQLYADWLITTGHLTFLVLSVLFGCSEDAQVRSGSKGYIEEGPVLA